MTNKNVVRDYAIQYAVKAFNLTSTQQALLISLLHCWCRGQNNVCNPSREWLSMSSGIKKLDDVTKHGKSLEEAGILQRKIYVEEGQRNKRIQYNINAEHILECCQKIESEWYSQWKEDDNIQAGVIANPEQYTEQEVELAVQPEPKPVPEGMVKNPITNRVEKRYEAPVSLGGTVSNLLNALFDERSLEQQKIDAENAKWNKQRESTLRYQQANKPSFDDEDPFAPF